MSTTKQEADEKRLAEMNDKGEVVERIQTDERSIRSTTRHRLWSCQAPTPAWPTATRQIT